MHVVLLRRFSLTRMVKPYMLLRKRITCNVFGQSQLQFCVDSHVQNKTMRV